MSRAYFATIIAIFVTTSLATNLLLIGARGPVALGIPAKLRFRRRLSRRIRRLFDAAVAAMIARRERQATRVALRDLNDRELRDIGLCCDCLGNISDMCGDRVALTPSPVQPMLGGMIPGMTA
jgi:uncharacterized protein YjiS (DUF1127 family)